MATLDTLRLTEAETEPERQLPSDSTYGTIKKQKLLVVDDEIAICLAVCGLAERIGYEAVYVQHGRIESQYSNEIAAIILDLFMPGMDGVETLRYLADKGCKAPIILISGSETHVLRSAQILAEGRGLSVKGVLKKPFSLKEIQNLLVKAPIPSGRKEISRTKVESGLTPQELSRAIRDREICPYFQPRVRIDTGKVVGFEALARWEHPYKGTILPGDFIPLAEQNGLIHDLTMLMLDRTFAEKVARFETDESLEISLNISARLLNDLNLPERLAKKAADYGLAPSEIVLEVTESALAEEVAKSLDILIRLRMKGFLLSVDDFGTGYSSMLQLQRVPFSELKIDRSFVVNMDADEDYQICEAVIGLGHKRGMKVIAEGIETKASWDRLKKLNCDLGQGYLFGKPMRAVEFEDWYRERA